MGAFSLYSPSILHPNLPLVDFIGDLLDACPIKKLLKALWIVVNWNIIVQVSFSHKCSQLIKCKAFKMMVAAFFPDISSFVVGFLPWSLSSKEWLPFVQHSQSGRVSTFHNAFPRKLGSSAATTSSLLSTLVLSLLTPKLNKPYDHPRVSVSLGMAHGPTHLLGLLILKWTYWQSYTLQFQVYMSTLLDNYTYKKNIILYIVKSSLYVHEHIIMFELYLFNNWV